MAEVTRNQSEENLVWLDLEMTGLDEQHDVILQAALIVTDGQLQPLESLCMDIWQPAEAMASMVPFVREMHQKTGLLQRVSDSLVDVAKAENRLLACVSGWCPYRPILCGNSIHSDRKFIDRYMPALGGYLHYRMLDVSSFKILAERWYGQQAVYKKPTSGQHDALFDIQQSIQELQHYRSAIMRTKGSLPARPV